MPEWHIASNNNVHRGCPWVAMKSNWIRIQDEKVLGCVWVQMRDVVKVTQCVTVHFHQASKLNEVKISKER